MKKLIWILAVLVFSGALFAQKSPYPKSPVIKDVKFNWPTHVRLASGSDNWPVTWADDNQQYTVWGDGGGFGGTNSAGRTSIGVAKIAGTWHAFKAENVWGGYANDNKHKVKGKSYGIISINGVLYMWVFKHVPNGPFYDHIYLAHSKDKGETWTFSDWKFSREDKFMTPTFCNFGKDYQGARDEYVYSYFIRFQSFEGPDDYEDKASYLSITRHI